MGLGRDHRPRWAVRWEPASLVIVCQALPITYRPIHLQGCITFPPCQPVPHPCSAFLLPVLPGVVPVLLHSPLQLPATPLHLACQCLPPDFLPTCPTRRTGSHPSFPCPCHAPTPCPVLPATLPATARLVHAALHGPCLTTPQLPFCPTPEGSGCWTRCRRVGLAPQHLLLPPPSTHTLFTYSSLGYCSSGLPACPYFVPHTFTTRFRFNPVLLPLPLLLLPARFPLQFTHTTCYYRGRTRAHTAASRSLPTHLPTCLPHIDPTTPHIAHMPPHPSPWFPTTTTDITPTCQDSHLPLFPLVIPTQILPERRTHRTRFGAFTHCHCSHPTALYFAWVVTFIPFHLPLMDWNQKLPPAYTPFTHLPPPHEHLTHLQAPAFIYLPTTVQTWWAWWFGGLVVCCWLFLCG